MDGTQIALVGSVGVAIGFLLCSWAIHRRIRALQLEHERHVRESWKRAELEQQERWEKTFGVDVRGRSGV